MVQRSSWTSYVIWGSIAVCAVLASAVTIALVVGNHRGIQIAASDKKSEPAVALERSYTPSASQASPSARTSAQELAAIPPTQARDHEITRLNEALRSLAAERDRLEERLQKLEQNLGDITASVTTRPVEAPHAARIGQQPQAQIAAAPTRSAPPAGAITAPGGEAFLRYLTAAPMVEAPTAQQAPMQIHAVPLVRDSPAATQSGATRTEFAVDLGTEPNMDALRDRWTSLRNTHGGVLGNLRPLVSLREGTRPGSVELRLIAGPLANAGDAARICASLQTKGANCQTAVYDGQRLALR